jgi:hypothetical protein
MYGFGTRPLYRPSRRRFRASAQIQSDGSAHPGEGGPESGIELMCGEPSVRFGALGKVPFYNSVHVTRHNALLFAAKREAAYGGEDWPHVCK